MKQLLLLRHAKAVAAEPGMADRDRPLAERGHRDATSIGQAIARDSNPDLVLCSPALRTLETMADVVAAFSDTPESKTVESLYGGDPAAYLEAVVRQGGEASRILVVGHNPTIHALAMMLATSPDTRMRAKFPTAALAVLAFDSDDWAAIRPGEGDLLRFLRPKDLVGQANDD